MEEPIKKEASTVYLLPETKLKGKAKAKKLGRSFSVYIEDLINKDIESEEN